MFYRLARRCQGDVGESIGEDDPVPGSRSSNGASPSPVVRTRSVDVEKALVDAAEAVLVRDGPSGVTVRTVAAEAGVAPMGIYNHLGGKDGLVSAILIRGFDGLTAAISAGDEADAVERLRACGLRYREFALANPQHYAVMFEGALLIENPTEEAMQHAAAAFQALVDKVIYGMARGTIRPGDPVDTAQQIWSTVHGAVALELKGLVQTPEPEATYRELLELVIRGTAPSPPGAKGLSRG
jgi:AcrR family transcriptional regulator